ncbi:hypothetical protein AC578_10085 [Pseudocercospora eumusae]|uniref:Uncharacterized protein n=1 Tax=Pseudocercospora eumusae TaxID=321146 RepID=A0A139GWW4_9PEZI|nr:hypothetical protein AC578_10085 [Pseudocercospora eumusae]
MSENTLSTADRVPGTPKSAASNKPLPALPFRHLEHNHQFTRSKKRSRSDAGHYCPIKDARNAKFLEPRRPPLPPLPALNAVNAGRIWQNRVGSASPHGRMLVELPATEVPRNDEWPLSVHTSVYGMITSKPPPSDATDDILGLYETHSDRSDAILDWEAEAIGKQSQKKPILVSEIAIEPARTRSQSDAFQLPRETTFEASRHLERGRSRRQKHASEQHYVEWVAAERRKEEMRIRLNVHRARRRRKARIALISLFSVLVFAMISMAIGFLVIRK